MTIMLPYVLLNTFFSNAPLPMLTLRRESMYTSSISLQTIVVLRVGEFEPKSDS